MNGLPRIIWYYLITKYGRNFNSRASLIHWQDQQVKSFLKQILPKSTFYRKYFDNHVNTQNFNIHEWRDLPIIDKSIMMENFDDLNTVGIKKLEALEVALSAEKSRNFAATLNGYTIGMSSGTSGNRGLFAVSQSEQQAWAGAILAKGLPQPITKLQRIAFFLRANSNLYETVNKQRIQFQYFDLFKPVESHFAKLNEYAPTILVAPPSMLRLLADAKNNSILNINPIKIISVAEVLDPLDEVYIRKSFNQIVHQFYQCTEGFLGYTCEYGTLHLNEDILVIQKEYVDRDAGKFMPIITDFNRRTQPIIRYRLDDIITERKMPCRCGSILTPIESIEGRRDDIFYLPSKIEDKLIPIFPDFIRRAIIIASENIQEYQVVQKSLDVIVISLKVATEVYEPIKILVTQSLHNLFNQLHCRVPEVIYQEYEVSTIRHSKLRRVRRECSV
ncbi:F390 synthetase-related protein [Calothrix sp. UHCC 0171]|uniref:F390 synthetase-related protein n=1 Tax=Calothrix sp. UHCC 0171 TaxID=3110245 RepID=UPI002B207F2A|nr:F390 synthetase-related protein [Calothrix sp. UHCC 0171]MEA5573720.1 F390 synthetase-related protein [Calothrix sp. UHCC 0171]